MMPSTVSSERLEKILEVNSKAIEINTIVSIQYEKLLEVLNNMTFGNKDDAKSLKVFIETLEKQHAIIIESNKDLMRNSMSLIDSIKIIKDIVEKTDKTLFKLSVIIVSSSGIVTTLINVLAKVFF